MVVDETQKLLGTVSDGDIRRGLLQNYKLEDPISSIANLKPLAVPETVSRELVLEIMQSNRIRQIPIIDSLNRVVGLHLWDHLSSPLIKSNLMIIMAGGKGTRLMPHTEMCPKPMLKVGDKPMIEHIIEKAKSEGFKKFIISVNYLGHIVEDYFGSGKDFGIQIEYLRESEPLGTAGALSLLNPTPTDPFIVSNGDVMTDIQYGKFLDFHSFQQADATMAVSLHEWQNPFGVVQVNGLEITGFEEKPITKNHISAGVYALSPESLKKLSKNEYCDMPTLFTRLRKSGRSIVAYPLHEQWLDVGKPDDYEKAKDFILNKIV